MVKAHESMKDGVGISQAMKDYYAITYDALDRIMDYVTAQED
jgi:hypothetical protein